jgi:hypothetical protein
MCRNKLNKKGMFGLLIMQWIPRIIFLTVVVFAIILLIRLEIKENVNITNAELELFIKRMIYSPNGINYYDQSINRAYPGIIDLKKFKNGENVTNFAVFYGESNNYIAARLTLIKKKMNFTYNNDGYNKWYPLAQLKILGMGSATMTTMNLPVQVYDNGKLENDILNIEAITPNS